MPIMRVKEMREMSSEDRMKRLGEFKTELLRLKTMVRAGGTVENPGRIRNLRKTIAQILTIESEKRSEPRNAEKEEKKKK
jgi:large subunit ribosomal protein L29